MLTGHSMTLQNHMAARDGHPDLKFIDIGYNETSAHAGYAVEKIYTHAGMTLSSPARQALHDWEKNNRQHKLGVHRYSIEDFSLTQEMLENKYDAYLERFGNLL